MGPFPRSGHDYDHLFAQPRVYNSLIRKIGVLIHSLWMGARATESDFTSYGDGLQCFKFHLEFLNSVSKKKLLTIVRLFDSIFVLSRFVVAFWFSIRHSALEIRVLGFESWFAPARCCVAGKGSLQAFSHGCQVSNLYLIRGSGKSCLYMLE